MTVTLNTVPMSRWQLGSAGFNLRLRPRMSEGATATPAIPANALDVLREGVNRTADVISTELQALIVELDLASPAALRVDPNSATEISYIGSISPSEIRNAISVAAQQMAGLSERVLSGALAHYLTSDQVSRMRDLKSQADRIVSAIQGLDTQSISPDNMSRAEDYLAMHLSGPQAALASAEKAVVSAEAGSVPVLEPYEKNKTINIAIGVGLVTVAGLVLWTVLG